MVTRIGSTQKRPATEIVEDELLVYLRLCKWGYATSVMEAKTYDARTVMQAFAYEMFCDDYERAFLEVNK